MILLPGIGVEGFRHYNGPTSYYWLFISNVGMSFFGLPHHLFLLLTWTLSVEEQFYLIWPWVVLAAGKKRLIAVSLSILLASLILRLVMQFSGVGTEPIYTFTLARLDSLAIGSALAAFVRLRAPRWVWIRSAKRIALGAFVLVVAIRIADERIAPLLSDYKGPLMQSIGYTALAVLFGSLLILGLMEGEGVWLRVFNHPALKFLGRYSYAMYLLHMPVIYFTKQAFRRSDFARALTVAGSELPAQIVYFAVVFAIASLLALFSWHVWEKHFLRLKERFTNKSSV